MSCLGKILRLEIFGASHASSIGMSLEGINAGESIDLKELQAFVDRRSAVNAIYSTARAEPDKIDILSGIENGITNGKAISARILNVNQKSGDYDKLKSTPRPSHADYVARIKYAGKEDICGGGRFSGRMTAPMCIAGGIALQILAKSGVKLFAYISKIGKVEGASYKTKEVDENLAAKTMNSRFPLLDTSHEAAMLDEIAKAKNSGDSVGGVIECIAFNLPVGLGDAMFEGLESRLSYALFGIPAVKGIEFGSGFSFAEMRGSTANDIFYYDKGIVKTLTNHNGGINGGISNGMPLTFRVAFKPTPSIAMPQKTIDLTTNELATIQIGGRHDACIVPRAVPVVEAVAALSLLDSLLEARP